MTPRLKLFCAAALFLVGLSIFICSKIRYSKQGYLIDVIGSDCFVLLLGTFAAFLIWGQEP